MSRLDRVWGASPILLTGPASVIIQRSICLSGSLPKHAFSQKILGPSQIWFEGEENIPHAGRLKLLYSKPTRRFDLALNVDLLTEMPADIAFNYFRWFSQNVRLLLSINHSKNFFTVAQLAAFASPHEVLVRQACPAWTTYLEEVFVLRGPGPLPEAVRRVAFRTFVSLRARRHPSSRQTVAPSS